MSDTIKSNKAVFKFNIPSIFLTIKYNPKQTPEVKSSPFKHGANCQLFAYTLLSYYGYKIPPFRSSELWDDCQFTKKVSHLKPFDILMYSDNEEAWGAHIGLYLGDGKIIHLSKENTYPKIQTHQSMMEIKKYRHFIGAKRLI